MSASAARSAFGVRGRTRRQRGQSMLQTLVGALVLFGLYFGGTPVLGGPVGAPTQAPADSDTAYETLLITIADEIQSSSTTERDDAGLARLRIAGGAAVGVEGLPFARNAELTIHEVEGYGVDDRGQVGIRWGEHIVYSARDGALVRVQGAQQRVVATHVVGFHAQRTAHGTVDVVLVTGDSGAFEARRITAAPKN